MKRLPNIALTREELINIMTHNHFRDGGESIICRTDTANALDKIFIDPMSRDEKEKVVIGMSDNKFKKVKLVHQMNLLGATRPLATLSVAKELVGYRIERPPDLVSLEELNLTRKQQIAVLRNSMHILEYFSSLDVTYADVKADNILVNPKTCEAKFCDIDNMRVKDLPVDLKGHDVMRYYEIHGYMDETVDAYMHDLLTLKCLSFPQEKYSSAILLAIKRGFIPTGFKQGSHETIATLPYPQEFTGKYLAKYIKR